MLRDRLVCGINDNRIQRRLLAESDLDFRTAFRIAQAMESADKSLIDLCKADPHPSTVSLDPSLVQHTVPSEPAPTGKAPSSTAVNSLNNGQEQCKETCYHCGGRHKPAVCRFRDVKCHRCGKKGLVCRQKASCDNDRVIQSNLSDTSRQMLLVMRILTLFSFQFIRSGRGWIHPLRYHLAIMGNCW